LIRSCTMRAPTFPVAPSTMAEYSVFESVVTSHPAEPQMYRCRLLGISHYYCPARSCCESAWAFADLFPCRPVVAVGTTITGRPPHRSVRARLRIRLLLRMNSVEAFIRIWMQNTGLGNPSVQQRGKTFPSHLRALTPTNQDAPPQPTYATPENA
jgi:hypothetical protein